MAIEEIFSTLQSKFGSDIVLKLATDAKDPWIEIAAERVVDVAFFLRDDQRYRFDHLNDLTAVDYCEPDEKKRSRFPFELHVAVVYHLTSYETRKSLVLKVLLPRWKDDTPGELPECPSVSSVWSIADWHEREVYDLVGVHFTDHPNLRRILTSEDWVGHPLRKDYEFPLEYHGIRCK
ncbi:NADH-quinone oxidoreductase subunit C [Stratiformator vulcanicus]|uniref:NADH-quinone oxidoreductase subunit C n=1 Tax=Stratiformator vulcanicus TaxID=2527980 RepID=A0A517R0L1_9PLAN|nr:NADH-quinone oxidoreductase subunit C [Stratiformator vulcanicus]QDT37408.1 NADH-quinone oxidoreductase subunit C 1 [Stratiformator vulcanicus]